MILTLYNTPQFQFRINQNKTTFIGPKSATTHLTWLITYLSWLITYLSWLITYMSWLIAYLSWLNIHLISMKQDAHNYEFFVTCNMQHESMKGRRYSCLSMMMMLMMTSKIVLMCTF